MTRPTPDGRPRTVAVVLAGGTGSRVGLDRPKQLLKVAGRTVIEHAVAALHECPEIDEIIVMMTAHFIPEVEPLLVGRDELPKVTRVLEGGTDRNDSTRRALAAIPDEDGYVLMHDAVRPLLPARVVRDCVAALGSFEAVDVAITAADTIIRVDDADRIVDIPERAHLRRGQTPQAFRLRTIRRAYELAQDDPDFSATDDCGVVLRYLPDVPIHVVAGAEQNMKITYPIDVFLVDKLFQLASHPPGRGHRERLAGKVVVVFGGSHGIGADVAALAAGAGATVHAFSRSSTGTHVERADSVADAVARVLATDGRIDAVVVTAGRLVTGPLAQLPDEDVSAVLDVNLVGAVNVARACAAPLRATSGHLVLFTSSSYTRGRAGYALYSATKAAIVNLAQALADEWSDAGVHVNVVNPERTRTPMREQAFGDEPDHMLLDSRTVAGTVLDVITSASTGQVVDVRRDNLTAGEIEVGEA
ncbi:SDR family NAD(P)-dependent oxidoreductase [Jatrophihabitans fulvus]